MQNNEMKKTEKEEDNKSSFVTSQSDSVTTYPSVSGASQTAEQAACPVTVNSNVPSKGEEWHFQLEGLSCAACAAAVRRALQPLEGIADVEVNPLTQKMRLELIPDSSLRADAVVTAVEKAGYGAMLKEKRRTDANGHIIQIPADEMSGRGGEMTATAKTLDASGVKGTPNLGEEEYQAARKRFWPSLVFMLPLMYLTMGPMVGLPLPGFFTGVDRSLQYALTQFLLTLPVIYINRDIFRRGFLSLWRRNPNMDALIAVGSGAALLYSVVVLYQMAAAAMVPDLARLTELSRSLYFESSVTILTLIALGRMLEGRAKAKTGGAIAELMELLPPEAEVERNGETFFLPIEEIRVGDIVVIRPGQKLPVDGTLLSGYSSLDTAAVTGESIPVEKVPGDQVLSGMINQAGSFRYRADKLGRDSTLAQMIRLVEEASSSRAPIAKLADRVAAIFVPTVIGIALLTLIIHLLSGTVFDQALGHAITVLVISCPCALGLATPVAIMVATGQGAKHGILFRSGEALEHAAKVDTVVCDKTGTLTLGRPRVTTLVVEDEDDELVCLTLCASVEAVSEHPLASAVVQAATEQGLTLESVENFTALPGRGVKGVVQGKKVLAGNVRYLKEENITVPSYWAAAVEELVAGGKTPLYVVVEGKLRMLIGVADSLKKGSAQAIQSFKESGLKTVLLTGDLAAVAVPLAEELGIEQVFAEVLPADKADIVRNLTDEGRKVMMLGDGINDAPALAMADVGVAMGGGTDIAMETSDVVLLNNDLRAAVNTIALSKATLRTIKQNLFWAFIYNIIGIPLAAGLLNPWGLTLTPMYGAAAMSCSSLFVVSNALRLRRFIPPLEITPETETGKHDFKPDVLRLENRAIKETVAIEKITEKSEGEEQSMNHCEQVLTVEGMMCQHCARHVKEALEGLGLKAEVDLDTGKVKVSVADSAKAVTEDQLRAAIEDAGYQLLAID